jgi:hypothetical protein
LPPPQTGEAMSQGVFSAYGEGENNYCVSSGQ